MVRVAGNSENNLLWELGGRGGGITQPVDL